MVLPTTCPPRCYSCQTTIGHVYRMYVTEYRKRVEEVIKLTGIPHGDLASTKDDRFVMGQFLTDLGIHRTCCRTKIIGHKNV